MANEKVTPGMERKLSECTCSCHEETDRCDQCCDGRVKSELLRVVQGMEAEAVNIRKMFLYHMADEISDYLDEYLVQLRKEYGLEDTP